MQKEKRKKVLFIILITCSLVVDSVSAQVGIGTVKPDVSSVLDIVSPNKNKGLLIPRVRLAASTGAGADLDGIQGQALGLLVYNTGGALPGGFYYWDGSQWLSIESATAVEPHITDLQCGGATLEPQSFTAGKPYAGIMEVPYLGGNGGKYSGATSGIPSTGNTGLRARLKGGRLEYGMGFLVYEVTGTPAKSSPSAATFEIAMGGKTCRVTVGEEQNASVTSVAVLGPLEVIAGGYQKVINSPDGKFSVRVYLPTGVNLEKADIQIRSNKQDRHIMYNGQFSWEGGASAQASNAMPLKAGVWSADKGIAWGDADVYYEAPEQRSYMWTSTDLSDKTMYHLLFTMGAPKPSITGENNNYLKTKVYFKIDQIHAD
jgi:hypothetical protein